MRARKMAYWECGRSDSNRHGLASGKDQRPPASKAGVSTRFHHSRTECLTALSGHGEEGTWPLNLPFLSVLLRPPSRPIYLSASFLLRC